MARLPEREQECFYNRLEGYIDGIHYAAGKRELSLLNNVQTYREIERTLFMNNNRPFVITQESTEVSVINRVLCYHADEHITKAAISKLSAPIVEKINSGKFDLNRTNPRGY